MRSRSSAKPERLALPSASGNLKSPRGKISRMHLIINVLGVNSCALIFWPIQVDYFCAIPHHLSPCWGRPMPARRVTKGDADRLTITLDARDRAEAEKVCKKLDRSLAWLVRTAVREY